MPGLLSLLAIMSLISCVLSVMKKNQMPLWVAVVLLDIAVLIMVYVPK